MVPAFAGTTTECASSFSRHDLSELCQFVVPLSDRGRRESRALTAPAAPCAMTQENAHGLDRYSRDIPAFPAQWLDGLYVLSPVSGLYCHRCQVHTGGPDRRQGRGARTTRFRRTLRRSRLASKARLTPQASIATRATLRDDRETSLWRHGLGDLYRKSELSSSARAAMRDVSRSLRSVARVAMDACDVRLASASQAKRRSVRRNRVVLAPRPWRQAGGKAHLATVTTNAAHRGEHV